jgi:serine/threonine-protein kinase
MAGGMREWMGDVHGERSWQELCVEPEPAPASERCASPERMIRSGNWVTMAEYCRSASRSRFFALTRGPGVGFRLARSLRRATGRAGGPPPDAEPRSVSGSIPQTRGAP